MCEYACTARMSVDSCLSMSVCMHVCQCVLYSICASCPALPSGRMCNGDKLLLLASRGFTADVFQVCVMCVFCAGLVLNYKNIQIQ